MHVEKHYKMSQTLRVSNKPLLRNSQKSEKDTPSGPDIWHNGCVSIQNYERFLKAYNDGEVTRLVVVPNLTDSITASRRSPAPS